MITPILEDSSGTGKRFVFRLELFALLASQWLPKISASPYRSLTVMQPARPNAKNPPIRKSGGSSIRRMLSSRR